MSNQPKTKTELLQENAELRARLAEAEEVLRAIRSGEVDALAVGDQIYTLQGADQPYRVLVETMNEGAATLGEDGTMLYCNHRFSALLNAPLQTLIGSALRPLVRAADRPLFDALLTQGKRGYTKGELSLTRGEATVPVQLSLSPLEVQGVQGVCLVATDLTEQKRNEEILAAEQLAGSILEQATEAIVVCDPEGKIIRASLAAARLSGQAVLFQPLGKVFPLHPNDNAAANPSALLVATQQGATRFGLESQLIRPDGSTCHVQVGFSPLRNAQAQIIGSVISLADITEHKQAEAQLAASLREKETLLREIHHRVKNNLQVISSLLHLQSAYLKDPQDQTMFEECQDRVRTMALIHTRLYESQNFAAIDFGAHARELATMLLQAYQGSRKINLELHTEVVPLDLDTAIPASLIVNELVTNALKHAFPGRSEGRLDLELRAGADGKVHLRLADDGIGLPADLDWQRTQTLGLRLVWLLSQQLNGTLTVQSGPGTDCRLCFLYPHKQA